MRRTLTICTIALIAGSVGGAAWGGDGKKAGKAAPPKDASGAEEKAMMAAMARYGQPGEQHRWLQALVGSWTTQTRAWMGPGKPVESTGSSEIKAILGGRFVEERFSGQFMGKPFEGQGLVGYDLGRQKFVNTWIDNLGTWITTAEGTLDPAGKELTATATGFNPATGKTEPSRWVTRIESDKRHVFEVYDRMGDKEVKVMEVIYTRRQP